MEAVDQMGLVVLCLVCTTIGLRTKQVLQFQSKQHPFHPCSDTLGFPQCNEEFNWTVLFRMLIYAEDLCFLLRPNGKLILAWSWPLV